MRLRNKVLSCVALGLASVTTFELGTAAQHECFNGVANDYGVESVDDLSDKIMDDSGCFSIVNTLGLLGMGGTVIYAGAIGWSYHAERRRNLSAAVEPT